ncbi:hypothetical protein [Asaia platycodi]|nr:hypothetical protein [Asaia platycodi]
MVGPPSALATDVDQSHTDAADRVCVGVAPVKAPSYDRPDAAQTEL